MSFPLCRASLRDLVLARQTSSSLTIFDCCSGVIIGRGGATIATLRTESNVKAGVSKVVPGVADRILSVGGTTDGVAKVGV